MVVLVEQTICMVLYLRRYYAGSPRRLVQSLPIQYIRPKPTIIRVLTKQIRINELCPNHKPNHWLQNRDLHRISRSSGSETVHEIGPFFQSEHWH